MLDRLSKEVLLSNNDALQRLCDINITALKEHVSCKNKNAKLIENHNDIKLLNSKIKENMTLYVMQRNQCFTLKKNQEKVLF